MRIFYFSGFGHTRHAAEHIAAFFESRAECMAENVKCSETAILLFPVYCQNVPEQVKEFVKSSVFGDVYLIAVYGGFCHGNVLFDIQKNNKRSDNRRSGDTCCTYILKGRNRCSE